MLKLLEREASPQLELNDSRLRDNLMVRINDLIGGSQCISAGCVQESVRKAEHGNGKSHRRLRKVVVAKTDADYVLEERDPQYDVMLSQMVGRIRSKPGGKLEMGENKELYQKMFVDEEKQAKFLWWRVQFLERSIRKLDFNPGGTCTIFQVSDLRTAILSSWPSRYVHVDFLVDE
ncbi:hypothetical protein NL676_021419 [Syzygium grande]|nr:hypothetical protein NL676_021419 [Syzygium grande]